MMSEHPDPSFSQLLYETYRRGELINAVFEERVYQLVGVLSRVTDALASANIPYELIGGLAVLAHVQDVAPDEERTTKDVDLMINRDDLERVKQAAEKFGFRFRHTPGVDMLLSGEEDSARNAVHLIFAGEKTTPKQLLPNPSLNPVKKHLRGKEVMVVPLVDLVRMKLTTFRLKDQVHVQALDTAGLITHAVQEQLPQELLARLEQVRQSE
jgi:hypothetical protein